MSEFLWFVYIISEIKLIISFPFSALLLSWWTIVNVYRAELSFSFPDPSVLVESQQFFLTMLHICVYSSSRPSAQLCSQLWGGTGTDGAVNLGLGTLIESIVSWLKPSLRAEECHRNPLWSFSSQWELEPEPARVWSEPTERGLGSAASYLRLISGSSWKLCVFKDSAEA